MRIYMTLPPMARWPTARRCASTDTSVRPPRGGTPPLAAASRSAPRPARRRPATPSAGRARIRPRAAAPARAGTGLAGRASTTTHTAARPRVVVTERACRGAWNSSTVGDQAVSKPESNLNFFTLRNNDVTRSRPLNYLMAMLQHSKHGIAKCEPTNAVSP